MQTDIMSSKVILNVVNRPLDDDKSDTPTCSYVCNSGFPDFVQNHKCLSSVDLFFDNMGGISIFIIIVIAAVFAVSALLYFLASSNKKGDSIENDENLYKLRM